MEDPTAESDQGLTLVNTRYSVPARRAMADFLTAARKLWPSSVRGRVAVLLLAGVVLALSTAAVARADAYWNVWQGNLPTSGGTIAEHTPYGGTNLEDWQIRMSWTANSHYMYFLIIDGTGSWHGLDSGAGYEWSTNPPTPYDRWYEYDPHYYTGWVQAGGCENPSGLPTVYVNCRHAKSV